jgi:hypothetical protein
MTTATTRSLLLVLTRPWCTEHHVAHCAPCARTADPAPLSSPNPRRGAVSEPYFYPGQEHSSQQSFCAVANMQLFMSNYLTNDDRQDKKTTFLPDPNPDSGVSCQFSGTNDAWKDALTCAYEITVRQRYISLPHTG